MFRFLRKKSQMLCLIFRWHGFCLRVLLSESVCSKEANMTNKHHFFSASVSIFAGFVLSIGCGRTNSNSINSTNTSKSSGETLNTKLDGDKSIKINCAGSSTPLQQLTLELSKRCRAQNVLLKSKGLPACQQDECSEFITRAPAQPGSKGTTLLTDEYGNLIGMSVVLLPEAPLANQEHLGIVCYDPRLKADEFLSSVTAHCHSHSSGK